MLSLNEDELEILDDLFEFQGSASDVDAAVFRVRHEGRFKTIDLLCRARLIVESGGRYRLSVFALCHLKSEDALAVLEATEPLYRELQAHYRVAISEQIAVQEVARRANVELFQAQIALRFMTDVPWYSGWSHGFPSAKDATIGASERVLDQKTFSQALESTSEWAISRPADSLMPISLLPNKANERMSQVTDSGYAWHRKLQEPLPGILREIYESKKAGHLTLPALGIRTILDLVCSGFAGDTGTFQAKLAYAKRNGFMTDAESEIFSVAFDAGSAAAHRGHVGDRESLDRLLEVMEHVLTSKFRIGDLAKKIKDETPQRSFKK